MASMLPSPDEMLSDSCQHRKGKSFNICMQLVSAKQTWQQHDP